MDGPVGSELSAPVTSIEYPLNPVIPSWWVMNSFGSQRFCIPLMIVT